MALPSQGLLLRSGLRRAFAAIVLLGIAAAHGEQNEMLVSAWELKTVADHPPSTLNIKFWNIQFGRDGNWSFSGEMMGRYEGMKLAGHGTWSTEQSQLSYTAGSNHGRSEFTIKNGVLTLSPDPVVRPDGKTPVTATYRRVAR
ncbi:MAG TPA: hypothetical protein VHW09_00790 [Bryobacteraceae bacterium]|nr:hypothetical protein [Bryobacteraceae bacterium]